MNRNLEDVDRIFCEAFSTMNVVLISKRMSYQPAIRGEMEKVSIQEAGGYMKHDVTAVH